MGRSPSTNSITPAITLPASGSGMYTWDVYFDWTQALSEEQSFALLRERTPRVHTYSGGHILLHAVLFSPEIAPAENVRPDDARITLQGHGAMGNGIAPVATPLEVNDTMGHYYWDPLSVVSSHHGIDRHFARTTSPHDWAARASRWDRMRGH